MKSITTYRYIQCVLLVLSGLVSSCVNDDSFFPNESTADITSTIAIVSTLNDLSSKGNTVSENDLCFKFVYPLVLGYNTDATITINSFSGLQDIISSQRSNFNITGLVFPLEIIFNGSSTSTKVENEEALYAILRECQLNTFRDDFTPLFRQCYKLKYPIILFDSQKKEATLTNDEEFDRFLKDQNDRYQPDFKFPIAILVAPDFESVSISTYYEFYEVIDSCVGCPEIRFEIEKVSGNRYQIITNFDIKDGYELFLKINEEAIADAVLDGTPFTREFAPGTYKVCIKVSTPDCPNGIEVCKELVVTLVCPELFFEFEQQQNSFTYNFAARFEGIDRINYDWIVDNEVAEAADGGVSGDNRFSTTLTPGVHEVCMFTETPECPGGTEFCKEIVVCPELFFAAEQQGNTTSYDFFAEFLGMETVTYQWTINTIPQEQDGGANGDNTFTFQFDPGATYEVCILAEVNGCNDKNKFCIDVVVP